MKNPVVGKSERRRIDRSVERLLRDLKGVEPPLKMDDVIRQMQLDLQYYQGSDPSNVREVVHSIKVAGKNLLSSRTILGRVIKKLGLKGLLFWDDNRILIDSEQHRAKFKWSKAHECGHKLCEWHQDYLLGDSSTELSLSCHKTIEAEANYAAGQIAFMKDRFVEELMDSSISLASLRSLATTFGNSQTSTLWRMVEEYRGQKSIVGIVSEHPKHPSDEFDALDPCRYVIQSLEFRHRFGTVSEISLFAELNDYCGYQRGGPIGNAEVELIDDNGEPHEFHFESFCYKIKSPEGGHVLQVLTLGVEVAELSVTTSVGSRILH